MPADLGLSFSPIDQPGMFASQGQGGGRAATPVQQAIKILSLRLPRTVGAGSIAPRALLEGGPSSAGPQLANPLVMQLLRALLTGQGGSGGAPVLAPSPAQAPTAMQPAPLGAPQAFAPPPQARAPAFATPPSSAFAPPSQARAPFAMAGPSAPPAQVAASALRPNIAFTQGPAQGQAPRSLSLGGQVDDLSGSPPWDPVAQQRLALQAVQDLIQGGWLRGRGQF